MNRIHVVGVSPRTGTTLMIEALRACFSIDYCSSHEDRLFTRPPAGTNVFLSKAPRDIMVVGPSLRADPNLYALCMMRDPRDIICSKHKKKPDTYWAGLKFWKTYTTALKKLCDHPRFTLIKYEVFVSQPDEVQQRIAEKIPFLQPKTPFSQYHQVAKVSNSSNEALRGVRPIKPTSIGRWKKHKPRVAGQLELHNSIAEDLITFGYEKDDSWLRDLRDVKPDLRPSRHSEFFTLSQKFGLKLGKYIEAARRYFEQIIGRRININHPKKWFTKH